MTNDELNKLIERFNDEDDGISIEESHRMACGLIDREKQLIKMIKILMNHSKYSRQKFRWDSMDAHGFQFLHNDITDKLKELGIDK